MDTTNLTPKNKRFSNGFYFKKNTVIYDWYNSKNEYKGTYFIKN